MVAEQTCKFKEAGGEKSGLDKMLLSQSLVTWSVKSLISLNLVTQPPCAYAAIDFLQ